MDIQEVGDAQIHTVVGIDYGDGNSGTVQEEWLCFFTPTYVTIFVVLYV